MGKQPTQEQRIQAARHRCGLDPNFAFRVVLDIYRRNRPSEIRQRQHLGHDHKGFREEDLGHLVEVVERLERDGRWHEGNLADKHLVMREGRRYSAQWVRWQDAQEKARQEHMAFTAALLDGEQAESGAEAADNGHGRSGQGYNTDAPAAPVQGDTGADKAAQRKETMRKYNERNAERDPLWGAGIAKFAG